MSGLIRLLKHEGYSVIGSDQGSSEKVKLLEKEGIQIYKKHEAKNITSGIDEVIYSQAIPDSNPELQEARRRGVPTLSYPEALGKYTENMRRICIAGTHGKTTTTAMIATCLIEGGKDPTVVVGADVKELDNSNERLGHSDLAVLETCEYKRSFLNITPEILVITNIDLDHIDYFGNKKNYDAAFVEYMNMVPKNGVIFYLKDDRTTGILLKKIRGVIIKPIMVDESLVLSVPGDHNRRNASLAFNVARYLKVQESDARRALEEFSGTKRRLEYKGEMRTGSHVTKIYDDYGHHPTEIRATLSALRELYPKEKILTIFQPHQFSRTIAFLNDFTKAFEQTDGVIIPNIFAARDSAEDKESMPLEKFVAEISKHHQNVVAGNSLDETLTILKTTAKEYDIIITMGAGDVYTVGEALLKG
jgi:UDP-N-acetylmuramate--alanine ligase